MKLWTCEICIRIILNKYDLIQIWNYDKNVNKRFERKSFTKNKKDGYARILLNMIQFKFRIMIKM
jgi:hypothetical protein